TNMMPWELKHANRVPYDIKKENPIATKCYNFTEDSQQFFTKDKEQPYIQEKPFDWIRGYQTGGKSLLWARQTQRISDFDFEGPARDGFAVDWPIRYKDLAPWYSYVEKFVGISGEYDGLDTLPDGEFLKSMGLNATEKYRYQTGGKSLLWARQTQRISDFDFEGPARDGFAVDWPIRYKDLAPWYSYVEKFVGISGEYDGLDTLPDGEFLKSMGLNATEKY